MKVRIRTGVIAGVLALGVTPLAAQDFTLDPVFGEIALAAGFPDDPFFVDVAAGGDLDASVLSSECSGFVTGAPTYRLNFEGDRSTLYFSVVAQADTTLVVNDPSGTWHCDDNTYEIQPAVILENAPGGQYDIWIGTKTAGATANATLYLSEIGTGPEYLAFLAANAPTDPPDPTLPPGLGEVTLTTGFTPDPHVMEAVGGGPLNASALGGLCVGFIAEAPDVALNFTAGTLPLIISVVAEADTTLVVLDPAGNWICDDDAGGDLNPYIDIGQPVSGRYLIWIGTYNAGAFEDAELRISEVPG